MAEAAAANGGVVRGNGMPDYASIEELATQYREVMYRIARQTPKGRWGAITSNIIITPHEILDLDQRIAQMAGGGHFLVDIYDPTTRKPLLGFTLDIEGRPREVAGEAASAAGMGYGPPGYGPPPPAYFGQPVGGVPTVAAVTPHAQPVGGAPPPPGFTQAWTQGPNGAWVPMYVPTQQGASGAPATSFSSDEMAVRQIKDLQRDHDTLKKELKALQDKLDEAREKHLEFVEKAKERESDLKMAAMEARLSKANGDGGGGMTGFAALATALAPVATSMMTSSKDQAIAMQQAQTTLITSALRPRDDSALMPLVLRSLDLKDPKHQIDAMDAAAQSQMAMFGMMSQIVNMVQQGQPPDSPMMQLLNTMLAGAGALVDKWMQKVQGGEQQQPPMIQATVLQPRGLPTQPAPGQPQQQPAQPQAQPASVAGGATYTTEGTASDDDDDDDAAPSNGTTGPAAPASAAAQPQAQQQSQPTATQIAQQVVQGFIAAPEIPAAFKTQPWRDLIFRIHARLDVGAVAAKFLDLLRDLKRRNALPPVLATVFANPEEAITGIIGGLPIIQMDVAYATKLRDLVVDTIIAESRGTTTPTPALPAPAN